MEVCVALSDYEKFQQQMFNQLDELEQTDQQRLLEDFVAAGNQCGVDVIAEIVDRRRPVSEVVAEVRQKQRKL
jgi:hypothetical protein